MGILNWIEQRVSEPGDSETQRSKKTLAVIILFMGAIITTLTGFSGRSAGLVELGNVYFVLAVLLLAASLLIVAFPRHYVLIVLVILIINLISVMISHCATGGPLPGSRLFRAGYAESDGET